MWFKTHSWHLHIISLDTAAEMSDGLSLHGGLERKHMLLFQKTQVLLPASTPGRLQLSVIRVQENLMPPASTDTSTRMHIPTCRHTYILLK